jgi:hypothetical protein
MGFPRLSELLGEFQQSSRSAKLVRQTQTSGDLKVFISAERHLAKLLLQH